MLLKYLLSFSLNADRAPQLKAIVGALVGKANQLKMIGKPKLAAAVICILTFCIVTVVIVDAVVPFGYIFVHLFKESDVPFSVLILLPLPIAGLLASSFITHPRARGVITSLSALGLVIIWVLGLILFVAYPMYPTPHPSAAKIVPVITSVPFVAAIIVTMWHSTRNIFSGDAPQPFS